MKYRILEKSDYSLWNEFVESSPQGSLFCKSFYLDSVGCSYRIGAVEENDKIIGGIVLSKNEVNVFSNPLFVKFLGVIYGPAADRLTEYQSQMYKIDKEIISHLRGWNVWSYSFHPNFENWLNFYWAGYKQTTRYTYRIEFAKTVDFRSNYDEKVKSPLRAARKAELVVDDIDVETFVNVNEKTYSGKGGHQPYSKKRLMEMLIRLNENKCLCIKSVKDKQGNVHCVAAIAYDKRSVNLILNGSDPAYRQFGGNSLLIDYMIEFASKKSEIFDFEGSMHERIEKFYRGFGARITPYYQIYKANLPTAAYHCFLNIAKKLS